MKQRFEETHSSLKEQLDEIQEENEELRSKLNLKSDHLRLTEQESKRTL
jgi:prefoldin subunit 5